MRKEQRKKNTKIKRWICNVLIILGSILIILGIIDIIPDLNGFGFKDIAVILLFLFIINLRGFCLIVMGLVTIIIASLIRDLF